MEVRLSQRQPRACQECTKRKRKCDKQIPCGRCRRLNHPCVREKVRLRRLEGKHDDEIVFLQQLEESLVNPIAAKAMIQARIDDLRHGSMDDNDKLMLSTPEPATVAARSDDIVAESIPADNDAPVLSALEQMAWGRGIGACFPHTKCWCAHRQRSETGAASYKASLALSRIITPHQTIARKLVNFHLEHIVWHHNCLHSTTFLEQCEIYWSTGILVHAQWMPLYLAVLSTTLYCVGNSDKFSKQLGLDASAAISPSARDLFMQMIDLLYAQDFLGDISLFSVQAIVISTEVAHNFGYSQLNAVLLGAAIRMAQCLGLDKIAHQKGRATSDHYDLVQITIGQRTWCQMLIQDLFAIPFNGSYAIITDHCSTEDPVNCDDDLQPREDSILTQTSYIRVLARLAVLMPELADGLGSAAAGTSTNQQYAHILRMDQKMRSVVRAIPATLLRDVPTHGPTPPWLAIARRSLAVTAADKIIMIHRPFIFRAFQSPTFSYTRRTCVAASLTILREHEAIAQSDDISLWTHTAFCITAAVILCLEILFQSTTDSSTSNTYRQTVEATRERLIARRDDVLAARGVALIDILVGESASTNIGQADQPTTAKIDVQSIMEKFFAVDQQPLATPSAAPEIQSEIGDPFLTGLSNAGDFDVWFNDTFNENHDLQIYGS